jgi:carboxyvinyl-carboxyphosphonate phosphorylmutase
MAAQKAVYETLKALREGVQPKDLPLAPRDDLMARVTREKDYKAWTKAYQEPPT